MYFYSLKKQKKNTANCSIYLTYVFCEYFFFLQSIEKLYLHLVTILMKEKKFILLLQINLRLILVSGKTKEFLFSPLDSAGEIAKTVFDIWPEG